MGQTGVSSRDGLHAMCSVWESSPAGWPKWWWVSWQWSRERQMGFWSVWSWQLRWRSTVLCSNVAGRQRSTVGSGTTSGCRSVLVILLRRYTSRSTFDVSSRDARSVAVARSVKWQPRPSTTHISVTHIPRWQPGTILSVAWCITNISCISFLIIQRQRCPRCVPLSIVQRLFGDNCNTKDPLQNQCSIVWFNIPINKL